MESAMQELRVTPTTLALRSDRFEVQPANEANEALPLDLREWFAPALLANWVEEAIGKLRAQEPGRAREICGAGEPPALPGEIGSMDDSGRTILTMLSFSYLTGVFASSEVARDARRNTPLRLLSSGIYPFRQELSRFRRRHRALMMAVMFQVFVRAVSEKLGARRMAGGADLHERIREAAMQRLDIAMQLDHAD